MTRVGVLALQGDVREHLAVLQGLGADATPIRSVAQLDDVPGIGPARKKALLMHFGTARAVRNASLADLQRAPGVSAAVAQQLYDFFHTR